MKQSFNNIRKVLFTVYMSTLTYWSFCLFVLYVFLCGANLLYVRLSFLSHEFEQFGSLHMCAPRKDVGRRGLQPGTPGLWVNHATNELSWRHIGKSFIYIRKWVGLYYFIDSGK